jgi:hypothetical protein
MFYRSDFFYNTRVIIVAKEQKKSERQPEKPQKTLMCGTAPRIFKNNFYC